MIEFDRNQLIRAYMEQDGLNHEEAVKEVDKYLDYMKKQEELARKNLLRKFTTYAGDFTITDENGNRII